MSAPQLNAVVQGVGSVNADNLNTYMQTADTSAQLRQFVGLPGIEVALRGITAPNDGEGGFFYWDAAATGPDDNFDVIVPTGASSGAWIRLNLVGPVLTTIYDLAIFIEGAPTNAEIYPIFNIVRNVTLPIGLAGSKFTVGVLPTGSSTFTLYKNGVSIGTIVFSTLGVPTVTFTTLVAFAPGDQFSISAPGTADATMANIAMTIIFTVV